MRDGVRPLHQRREIAGQLRRAHLDAAFEHLAGGAVDGDDLAFAQRLAENAHGAGLGVDAQRAGAAHARPAHAARDDGRVARLAAARGQDAGAATMPSMSSGLVSSRTRMQSRPADFAALASTLSNTISPEAAPGEAGKARRQHDLVRRGIDGRVQQLVELVGLDAQHRLLLEMTPSRARSMAILKAALVVRLPERVCSIQSLPSWMVNSMSCMSR